MSRCFDSRWVRVALIVSVIACVSPRLASAAGLEQWTPNGVPVATVHNGRWEPMAAPDQAGGAFVVWQQAQVIRMQRLTAAGTPAAGWSASNGLLVCNEPLHGSWPQTDPRVIPDGAGGAYVMWNDQRNQPCTISCLGDPRQMVIQRITAAGAIASGWPALGVMVGSVLGVQLPTEFGLRGTWVEMNPVIVPDGLGGALIAWSEVNYIHTSDQPGIHVQRIAPDGSRMWGERGIVVCAGTVPRPSEYSYVPLPGSVTFPVVAADGGGGAYVAWQDLRDPSGSRVCVQHVSSSGIPLLAPNGESISDGSANARYPQIVSQSGGGALVVWEGGEEGASRELFAKSLANDKRARIAIESPFCVDALPDGEVTLASNAGQGAWVSWIGTAGAERVIRAQKLLSNGTAAPGWPEGGIAASAPSVDPRRPMLVDAGPRGVYVGWRDPAPRITRLLASGARARGWAPNGLVLLQQNDYDDGVHMVSDGASGVIVAWSQYMDFSGLNDLRGQRVCPLEKTPANPFGLDEAAETLDAGTLDTPAASFALGGLSPNPSQGPLTIVFSLPNALRASLEVFDLLGRRVAQREVGALGAGVHRVTLGAGEALHPGVYQIRLTQGERRLTSRGVVTP